MNRLGQALLLGAMLTLGACNKVPIVDIHAGFTLADAAWFEEEQTLFFFYVVSAEQGLGPASVIEVNWRTDDTDQAWTAVADLPQVHTHLPVDCGPKVICGSASIKVEKVPRQVGIRLRFHRDAALSVDAKVTYNPILAGPAHSHRSLAVYGVFDETNDRVQWRARHQFPVMRNEQAEQMGLRREFHVADVQYGDLVAPVGNPYGYALAPTCPAGLTALSWAPIQTSDRAIFDLNRLPLEASASLGVCARTTVTDAKGTFDAPAIARKNPEVHPAFPVLRSPIRPNTKVGFLLRPCRREISKVHQSMQVQRLILEGAPQICIDDFRDPSFGDTLTTRLRARIELVRADGKDMVLAIALHHDDTTGALGLALEKALEQILPFESGKSSPRVSGAFVFDSLKHEIASPALRPLVLWCPANVDEQDLDKISDESERSCALQPDTPDLTLGPFKFSNLAILPTRPQYLTFIAKYSEAQAGRVVELGFVAPERTPTSTDVRLGNFGVGTFFNNEKITAGPDDAFSFCVGGGQSADGGFPEATGAIVIFRSAIFPMPLPISTLPQFHEAIQAGVYEIGLAWDFPFLTRMHYELAIAAAVTAFSVTVPFGVSAVTPKSYGSGVWAEKEFPLAKTLVQCSRFCDHPTFDSDGVYNLTRTFRQSFKEQCYVPRFPLPSDGTFPHDP